jgi:TDG/mug DNA glycosylase family protein
MSHALPDLLVPNLRVVFCGTAAGDRSASVGAYYAGRGNRFWATLHRIGLTPHQLAPADFRKVVEYGIGLTDLAKFRSGLDSVLRKCDFDAASFRGKITQLAPGAVAFNGKKAAAEFLGCLTRELDFGRHRESIGVIAIWVLPSTSGAAGASWDPAYWQELADWMNVPSDRGTVNGTEAGRSRARNGPPIGHGKWRVTFTARGTAGVSLGGVSAGDHQTLLWLLHQRVTSGENAARWETLRGRVPTEEVACQEQWEWRKR